MDLYVIATIVLVDKNGRIPFSTRKRIWHNAHTLNSYRLPTSKKNMTVFYIRTVFIQVNNNLSMCYVICCSVYI